MADRYELYSCKNQSNTGCRERVIRRLLNSCVCQISDISMHDISHYQSLGPVHSFYQIHLDFSFVFITPLVFELFQVWNISSLLGYSNYFQTALSAKNFYFNILPSIVIFPNHRLTVFVSWNHKYFIFAINEI